MPLPQVFSSMGASQGVVVGSTHGHLEFLQAAPWKPVALGKKIHPAALCRLMTLAKFCSVQRSGGLLGYILS